MILVYGKTPKVYEKICRLAYGEVFLVSIIILFYPMGYLQENGAKFRSSLEFNSSVKNAVNHKTNYKINYVIQRIPKQHSHTQKNHNWSKIMQDKNLVMSFKFYLAPL